MFFTINIGNLEQLIVYPSRTSQFLFIDTHGDMRMEDISIYNFSGSKIDNFLIKTEENRIEINVSDLPKGIYFIIIIERKEGIIKRGKFIVTK